MHASDVHACMEMHEKSAARGLSDKKYLARIYGEGGHISLIRTSKALHDYMSLASESLGSYNQRYAFTFTKITFKNSNRTIVIRSSFVATPGVLYQ